MTLSAVRDGALSRGGRPLRAPDHRAPDDRTPDDRTPDDRTSDEHLPDEHGGDPSDRVGGGEADDRFVRRVAGDHLDDAVAFLARRYGLHDTASSRTGDRFSWEHAAVGDGRMAMRTSRFLASLRGRARIVDEFVVLWNRSGRSTLTIEDRTVHLPPGRPILLPTDRAFSLHHIDVVHSLVHVSRPFVERLAGTSDDPDGTRLAFDPFGEPSAAALTGWRQVVRRVSSGFLDLQHPPGAIARRAMAESIADAVLTTFPRRSGLRLPEGRIGPEIDRVRRAVEFVHANAHLPIGTADIAAAADLSARGLQQSLRRNLDTTPGDLLRTVRLEGAHEDLRQAEPGTVTVAAVARAWGFGHLGRFSASYREHYGHLPNETLRAHR